MPITDADQALVVKQLIHDLHATLGSDYDYLAVNNAGRLRQFIDDRETYFEKVVDATQQTSMTSSSIPYGRSVRATRILCGVTTVHGGARRTSGSLRVSENLNRMACRDDMCSGSQAPLWRRSLRCR
jgi:hypothetical protein